MNKIILMGRLTREPEVMYSQGDKPTAIAKFTLAVNRKYVKKDDSQSADFFNCTAFGKQGEFAEKYLRQGIKILLTGHIQNDNYTNKDGQKVYGMQVIVEEIEFAQSKGSQEGFGAELPGSSDDFTNIPDIDNMEVPFK